LRVLAVIDHGYDDDLRCAVAEALSDQDGTWQVRVTYAD
jgi:hypothetical protein